MAKKGKTQLLITFVARADQVSEVDRLAASHASWMKRLTTATATRRC